MTNCNNDLWLQSWCDNRSDFHQEIVNQLLVKCWPGLNLIVGSRVFVPLCGKSLDILWLAEQGHSVIGVELSPVAVGQFFKENGLPVTKCQQGEFTLWSHDRIHILCGDFFLLNETDLGHVDIVYDRAALTALPENIRSRYVEQLALIVPDLHEIFLLTTEDAEEGESLDHALGVASEIKALYSRDFEIALTHVESITETDQDSENQDLLRVEYKAYRLSSKIAFNLN